MKKVLAIITMFSFMVAGEMGLSAYGGLGLANMTTTMDTEMKMGMKPGLTIGVTYDKLPVIVGGGISFRGSVWSHDSMPDDVKVSYTYLDLLALYPYAAGPGNIMAGLNIGVNLSATADDGTDSEDVEDVSGLDYGLYIGYSYPINETMAVNAGYYLGLANADASDSDETVKHNGIILTVGYALPF